jgi:hypothetical protein
MGGMNALRVSSHPANDAERFAAVYRRYRDLALHDFDIRAAWERQIAGSDPLRLPA